MNVEQGLHELSRGLAENAPRIARRIFEQQDLGTPSRRALEDVFSVEIRQRNIRCSLDSIFTGLADGRTVSDEPPAAGAEFARVAARSGVALQDLVRAYRLGHSMTWDCIMAEAEGLLTPEESVPVLRLASRFLFDWNNRVIDQLSDAYQRELDQMYRDRERRRHELIRDVLEGLPIDTGQLGYELSGFHVGLVAWGANPEDFVTRLAGLIGGPVLRTSVASGSVFAWFAEPGLDDDQVKEAIGALPLAGVSYAVGRPGEGVAGFRRTHDQAIQAWRVGLITDETVTLYQQATIEAVTCPQPKAVRDFVDNELGQLLTDDPRDHLLRLTLAAYFKTGENAASTAPLLGVHERTVAYRLRTIERRLGYSIRDRREELAVALRLLPLVPEHASDHDAAELHKSATHVARPAAARVRGHAASRSRS